MVFPLILSDLKSQFGSNPVHIWEPSSQPCISGSDWHGGLQRLLRKAVKSSSPPCHAVEKNCPPNNWHSTVDKGEEGTQDSGLHLHLTSSDTWRARLHLEQARSSVARSLPYPATSAWAASEGQRKRARGCAQVSECLSWIREGGCLFSAILETWLVIVNILKWNEQKKGDDSKGTMRLWS